MDYFYAVQEGRKRCQRAVALLQDVAGPCYPMLFLKLETKEWTPVGEETLYSTIPGKNETGAIVFCDSEGNSKAMSAWLPRPTIESIEGSIRSRGIPKFDGEVKLPT